MPWATLILTVVMFKFIKLLFTYCSCIYIGMQVYVISRCGSTLVQVMACCLMATSHYLHQCWLIIKGGIYRSAITHKVVMNLICNMFRGSTFKITFTSPRGQWGWCKTWTNMATCVWYGASQNSFLVFWFKFCQLSSCWPSWQYDSCGLGNGSLPSRWQTFRGLKMAKIPEEILHHEV